MSFMPEPGTRDSEESSSPLDPVGWVSLAAGLLVILITFCTSCNHVDFFGFIHLSVN